MTKKFFQKIGVQTTLIIGIFLVNVSVGTAYVNKKSEPPKKIIYNTGNEDENIGQHWKPLSFSFLKEEFINPKIIEELLGWISDPSETTSSIDLVSANKSNKFNVEIEHRKVNGKNLVGYIRSTDEGSFFYEYIGTSPSGVHMILCIDHGGGSGVFMSVMLLSLLADTTLEGSSQGVTTRERVHLNSVEKIVLGDRYSGEITYQNKILTIGEDLSPMKYGLWTSEKKLNIK